MIHFQCLVCGTHVQADENARGRSARCPNCGAVLQVPAVSTAPADVAKSPEPPAPRQTKFPMPQRAVAPPPAAPPPADASQLAKAARQSGAALPVARMMAPPLEAPPLATSRAGAGSLPTVRTLLDDEAAAREAELKPPKKSTEISSLVTQCLAVFGVAVGTIALLLYQEPVVAVAFGAVGAASGIFSISVGSSSRHWTTAVACGAIGLGVIAALCNGYKIRRTSQASDDTVNSSGGQTATDHQPVKNSPTQQTPASADDKSASKETNTETDNAPKPDTAPTRSTSATTETSSQPAAPAPPPVRLRLQGPTPGEDKQPPTDSPLGTTPAPSSSDTPATSENDTNTAPPKDNPAGPIHWAAVDQGEAQGNDDIKVTVSKVATGNFFYQAGDSSIFDHRETNFPILHIWVKVENRQLAGHIDYKGWMSLPESDVSLVDDKGNEIKRFDLKQLSSDKEVRASSGHPAASIGNSESNEDLIVFDLPPETANYLRLKLSGKAVGLPGDLYFEIPHAMIKPGDTGNPLVQ